MRKSLQKAAMWIEENVKVITATVGHLANLFVSRPLTIEVVETIAVIQIHDCVESRQ